MSGGLSAQDKAAQTREGRMEAGYIIPWAWSDPWAGHTITEGGARAEAHYARQMHDAAMAGRLHEFELSSKGPSK